MRAAAAGLALLPTPLPCSCAAAAASSAAAAPRPHLVFVLADDLGWANVGWHRRDAPTAEVQTPRLDALVAAGVELDRHYVYKFCSPTRTALQSGRNPVRVNVLNGVIGVDAANPASGFSGMARNMTGIAERLAGAGYRTHAVGKWHVGMATPDHVPSGRGYSSYLGYLGAANDFWTSKPLTVGCPGLLTPGPVVGPSRLVDLYGTSGPAQGRNNSWECSQQQQGGCTWEDELFLAEALRVVGAHDASRPLFLFYAPHAPHAPYEVPDAQLARFAFVDDPTRRAYHAMVSWLDAAVGNVTAALRARGMFASTLLVFSADNGGPVYANRGANNYPLRGGKLNNWEGGVRVSAFVSGGFVPAAVRGTSQPGLIAGWDWYATFCALAGTDAADARAAAAGLPPVDGVDVWPLISGAATVSPRTDIVIGDCPDCYDKCGGCQSVYGEVAVGGLISGRHKLLLGTLSDATWTGPQFPNATTAKGGAALPDAYTATCGRTAETGCLYDIFADPEERRNLAAGSPALFADMLRRADAEAALIAAPHRATQNEEAAACRAFSGCGDFVCPFLR